MPYEKYLEVFGNRSQKGWVDRMSVKVRMFRLFTVILSYVFWYDVYTGVDHTP